MAETTINQRLKILIGTLNLSTRAFSTAIGVGEGTTRNYLDRGSKPSSDYLERIVRTFERTNPTWLLTGEGEVFNNQVAEEGAVYQKNSGTNNVGNIGTNHGNSTVHYTSVADCEKDLAAAHATIALMASQIQDKELIIQLLKQQQK